jgi:hypothetical protein
MSDPTRGGPSQPPIILVSPVIPLALAFVIRLLIGLMSPGSWYQTDMLYYLKQAEVIRAGS